MDDHDHVVARLAQEPRQAQSQTIGRLEWVDGDLRITHTLGRVQRNLALKLAQLRQQPVTVDVPETPKEESSELLPSLGAR